MKIYLSTLCSTVWSKIKSRIARPEIIPFTKKVEKKKGQGFRYKGNEFIHHSGLHQSQSAFHRLSGKQVIFLLSILFFLVIGLLLNWHMTVLITVVLLTTLYFIDLLFNLYLIYRSFTIPSEIQISSKELAKESKKGFPTYTVLCPLYKEWQVLPQFVTAMSRLDYPKDKLQVMLLLEEDDKETIKKVQKFKLPHYFDIVIVPHSFPKTKPKACNYGLTKATGEYSVIYDAEDVPDPLQLKKVVIAFRKAGSQTICIQAKLNFYNPSQNLLTRLFTAEYSLWFDLVLTGLQSIHGPIPLGGTSNHFRTADLHKLKGWDSFNVTEDADLGMRLVKQGYQTAIIDSTTLEEANSDLNNWFWQRTRWIKGYMQTYLLHMRNPRKFVRTWKEPHVITFQLVIGGKVLSTFVNPLMWAITICYFAFRAHIGLFIESFFPSPILYMGVFSLILGNFLYLYYYMIGCAKHGHYELVKYAFFVPIYWFAMSVASWVALYELILHPHHWSKTKHGLHLNKEGVIDQATKAIGRLLVDGKLTNSSITPSTYISGLSIVLPAYNEEENIGSMIKKVNTFVKSLKIDYEIIIVNDGSKDNTKKKIDRLSISNKQIKTIHHPTNYGYGTALRSGFSAAKKEWIFFTDSDMQFEITELTRLFEKAQHAKLVIGYRENRQDPFIRILNANLYKTSLKLLFGLNVRDIDCAFKLFSREIITKNPLQSKGALINAELLVKAKRSKYKTIQVGVSHYPRLKGNPTGANPKVILRAMKELLIFRFISFT